MAQSSARPNQLGSRIGSARGSAQIGLTRLGSNPWLSSRLGSARLYSGLGSAHLGSVRALSLSSVSLGSALTRGTAWAGLVKRVDILASQSKNIHGLHFLEPKCYFDTFSIRRHEPQLSSSRVGQSRLNRFYQS